MKNCFFILLFFGLSFKTVFAQDLASTLAFADKQFKNEDFVGAADTYERVLFFDSSQQFANGVYIKLAECLFKQQKLDDAARQYEKAYYVATSDSLQQYILFQKATCHLLNKNYAQAQVELLNLPDSLSMPTIKQRELFMAMSTFAQSDFEAAQQHFNNVVGSDSTKQQLLIKLFEKNQKISKLNPNKAKRMSQFLPGLGQFYAGDIKNGLNSLLLTGGLLAWGVNIGLNSTFLDAAFTVVPWFQRYYLGGADRAKVITENTIKRRRHKVYNEILDVIER